MTMQTFEPEAYPNSPGVYLMKSSQGRIVYVGKAVSLRKRLASYFRAPEALPDKTRVMMGKVAAIDYLCTETEKEALLLEASLIKKHRPRYNIVLRDDKSYILFKLDKASDYPRLTLTRRVNKDRAVYFGPFTSALAARETLKALNRIFPLRKCKDTTFRNRSRPCLQHQIGRCLAPCVYDVSVQEYKRLVSRVELFLQGRTQSLLKSLNKEMQQAAAELNFERAASIRDQIRAISRTTEQQTVVAPRGGDLDVVGVERTDEGLVLGLLFIRQGTLLDSKSFFWPKDTELSDQEAFGTDSGQADDEELSELVRNVLVQFYAPGRYIPGDILVPMPLQVDSLEEILSERKDGKVRIRQAANRKEEELLGLARRNAVLQSRQSEALSSRQELARKLRLPSVPERIEAVDASHLAGQGTMVGQIVFADDTFKKSDYRLYSFPELEGSRDDYGALAAWAAKRLQSGPPWPDLVLIDGGKGQLAAVEQSVEGTLTQLRQGSLQSGLSDEELDQASGMALLSLAKGQNGADDKVYSPGRKNPVPLRSGGQELLFLQNLRDAVHRFVLSRQKRSRKNQLLDSDLSQVPGIGPKTAKLLWEHFQSLESIRRASPEDLQEVPGIGRAKAEQFAEALQNLEHPDRLGPSSW
jgi:excinuclease ABC subunit C